MRPRYSSGLLAAKVAFEPLNLVTNLASTICNFTLLKSKTSDGFGFCGNAGADRHEETHGSPGPGSNC